MGVLKIWRTARSLYPGHTTENWLNTTAEKVSISLGTDLEFAKLMDPGVIKHHIAKLKVRFLKLV